MWVSEQLNRCETAEPPHLGRVTRVDGGKVDVASHTRLCGVVCITGFGGGGLPAVGEEVLVLPGLEGWYCIGRPATAAGGEAR